MPNVVTFDASTESPDTKVSGPKLRKPMWPPPVCRSFSPQRMQYSKCTFGYGERLFEYQNCLTDSPGVGKYSPADTVREPRKTGQQTCSFGSKGTRSAHVTEGAVQHGVMLFSRKKMTGTAGPGTYAGVVMSDFDLMSGTKRTYNAKYLRQVEHRLRTYPRNYVPSLSPAFSQATSPTSRSKSAPMPARNTHSPRQLTDRFRISDSLRDYVE
eukprot:gene2448-3801_t